MSLRFVQSYPLGFVLLCLLLGALYAAVLYYRNRNSGFSASLTAILSLFRFLAVSLLALLLLSPLLQKFNRFVEEPLLIFVHDNSQSIVSGSDSTFFRNSFSKEKESFFEELGRRFETRTYVFGESFRESEAHDYTDRFTDISAIFSGIQGLYSNRNVGAVIVVSDGIFNRGANPVFLASGLPYPVYTMALGDTIAKPDLVVKRLNHNRITYLGNQFPVEVELEARQLQGVNGRLLIRRGGETIAAQNLPIRTGHHIQTVLFELEADRPGLQRYSVEIVPDPGETNTDNNIQEFFIEVIDSRQKVLLLANSPHPDVGAIQRALAANDNYELTFSLIENFTGQPETYNLLIMHQLPSARFPVADILQRAARSEVPVLFIVGAQTSIAAFNQARTGFSISPRSADFVEAQPALNPAFALFSLAENTIQLIGQWPPLHSPFASYQAAAGVHTLLYQKIGAVVTEQPLVIFSVAGGIKSGVVAGEGLWRWRMNAFARNKSHQAFDDLFWRMVQFLSVKEEKNVFRVNTNHFVYETDPVIFDAELYNPGFELVNAPVVQLIITYPEGVRFTYEMGRTSNAYRLNAGAFAPGDYSWEANTGLGGEMHKASGRFSVSALNIESLNTIANHNLLHQLSELSGGAMFYPGQWAELAEAIKTREDLKPVMYSQKEYFELINLKAVFFLLLLLLSAEWFLRKWKGSY